MTIQEQCYSDGCLTFLLLQRIFFFVKYIWSSYFYHSTQRSASHNANSIDGMSPVPGTWRCSAMGTIKPWKNMVAVEVDGSPDPGPEGDFLFDTGNGFGN